MAKNYTTGIVISGNARGGSAALTEVQRRLKDLDRQQRKTRKSTVALSAATKRAGSVFAGYLAAVGVRELIEVNRQFAVMRSSLTTATGSAEAASTAFKALQGFASKTPFSVQETTNAFIKLKNLGLDPSEEALRSYGNTASAMGRSLDQMIEAVADAATGEFERLKEFGIKAKSQGDQVSLTFQGVTTTIGKSASEIEQYLRDIGNTQFAGAMDRQMDTLDGSLSNLGDSWDNMLDRLMGPELEKAVSTVIDEMGRIAEAAGGVGDVIDSVLSGDYGAKKSPAKMGFGELIEAIREKSSAYMQLRSLNTAAEWIGLQDEGAGYAAFHKEMAPYLAALAEMTDRTKKLSDEERGLKLATDDLSESVGHFNDQVFKQQSAFDKLLGQLYPLQKLEREYSENKKLLREGFAAENRSIHEYNNALSALTREYYNSIDALSKKTDVMESESVAMQYAVEQTDQLTAAQQRLNIARDARSRRAQAQIDTQRATATGLNSIGASLNSRGELMTQIDDINSELRDRGGETTTFRDSIWRNFGDVHVARVWQEELDQIPQMQQYIVSAQQEIQRLDQQRADQLKTSSTISLRVVQQQLQQEREQQQAAISSGEALVESGRSARQYNQNLEQLTGSFNRAINTLEQTEDITTLFGRSLEELGDQSSEVSTAIAELFSTSGAEEQLAAEQQLFGAISQRYQSEMAQIQHLQESVEGVYGSLMELQYETRSSLDTVLGVNTSLTPAEISRRLESALETTLPSLPSLLTKQGSEKGLSDAYELEVQPYIDSNTLLLTEKGQIQANIDSYADRVASYEKEVEEAVRIKNRYKGGYSSGEFTDWSDNTLTVRKSFPYTFSSGTTIAYSLEDDRWAALLEEASKIGTGTATERYIAPVELPDYSRKYEIEGLVSENKREIQSLAIEYGADLDTVSSDFATSIGDYIAAAGDQIDVLGELRARTMEYYEAQKDLAALLDGATRSISDTLSSFDQYKHSSGEQVGNLFEQYQAQFADTEGLTGRALAAAAEDLNQMVAPMIELARETYASGSGFFEILDEVEGDLKLLQGRLSAEGADEDYAQIAAAALTTIDQEISSLDSGLNQADSLVVSAIDVLRTDTVNLLTQIRDELGYDGSHAGGLGYVPFNGYRAELHQGERVLTASQARQQDQSVADNSAELRAVRAVRDEIRALGRELRDGVATPIVKAVRRTRRDRELEARA